MLGDSAFSTSSVMVPAFKKTRNCVLIEPKEHFNKKLAKIRIKAEHCIGLIKARFQRLKDQRRVIQTKNDLKFILDITMCSCVLHNLMIDYPVPESWFEKRVLALNEDDELNQPINNRGGERRDQLYKYLLEIR